MQEESILSLRKRLVLGGFFMDIYKLYTNLIELMGIAKPVLKRSWRILINVVFISANWDRQAGR